MVNKDGGGARNDERSEEFRPEQGLRRVGGGASSDRRTRQDAGRLQGWVSEEGVQSISSRRQLYRELAVTLSLYLSAAGANFYPI